MKKTTCLIFIVLFLLGATSVADAGKFSIGAFGGLNIPLAQDDAKSGALYGAKGRILLLPYLGIEPYFCFAKYGGKDAEVREETFELEGGDITSFGADLVLGSISGFGKTKFYGLVGINSNSYKREGIPDETGLGVAFGSGVEFFPTEMLSLEFRAKYHPIKVGDGGRVHLEFSGGVNYYFGPE
ncbi:MAG: outer membrane beta-barrel protein [Candidatus Zixiibacteriota bacterium]|nr:MAG: outer membrane beta-barrel protein [candidate division Zixibacteria bacterium]